MLGVLAASATAFSLMQSLVIPALPSVQRTLDASPATTSWAVTGFLLSAAVATPIAGRLGDLLGKRRVLVAVLGVVCAGTVLCTVQSVPALIAGRVVQGVGAGVLPLAHAIVRDEFRPERVVPAIAILAALLGVGGGLGVILAGLVLDVLSYGALFWLQLPVFLAVAVAAHRLVPESRVTAATRIDWAGAALISAALVALLLTITQAEAWGLLSPATTVGAGLTVALTGAVIASGLREAAFVDVRLLRRRPVWTVNAAAFLLGVAQFVAFIGVPQYVQEPVATGYGFGASPLGSAVYLLPMTVAILAVGLSAARLERRLGARTLLVAAHALSAAGFALLTFARSEPWEVHVASGLLGLGTGLGMSTVATLIVSQVAQTESGIAAGMNTVARSVGGALGVQLAAVLLAGATVGGLPAARGYTLAFAVGLVATVVAVALARLVPAPPALDGAGSADAKPNSRPAIRRSCSSSEPSVMR